MLNVKKKIKDVKSKPVKIVFIILFLLFLYFCIDASKNKEEGDVVVLDQVGVVEIDLDAEKMEQNLYSRSMQLMSNIQDKHKENQVKIEAMGKKIDDLKRLMEEKLLDKSPSDIQGGLNGAKDSSANSTNVIPPNINNNNVKTDQDQSFFINDIGIISVEAETAADLGEQKEIESLYLPPSFMEATLLSGGAIPATVGGKSFQTPILFRVKAKAVLPNHVRSNFKGCLVMANAVGNLATERVDVRLVSISCISKDRSRVIDQKVCGFAVDSDGQVGIKGRPAAKMGAHIARSMLAGFFGGIAEVAGDGAKTVLNSPKGDLFLKKEQDLSQYYKLGVGKGIANALEEIQQFYLGLAELTMPVIEVGTTKKVHLVIAEGTELEVFDGNIRGEL